MSIDLIQFLKDLFFHPLFLPLSLFLFFLHKWLYKARTPIKNLPPSPPKLPILGNLHQLGRFPHRSLHNLSKKYGGGLMSINIGSVPAVVVSSAEAASEVMKTHDAVFSNRPHSRVMCRIIYGGKDLVFSPYGEYWRQIRSICVLQLFSNKKVMSFRDVREEEVSDVLDTIKSSVSRSPSSPVDMSEMFVTYSSSVLCRTAFGKKYVGVNGDGGGGGDFRELLAEFVAVMAVFSMGDFIPWLGWVDRVTGLERSVDKVAKSLDNFLERVVQEHVNTAITKKDTHNYKDNDAEKGENKDFVDILLDVQRVDPSALPMDSIKAIILDMFVAGTDTTFTLLEWAMTELLAHPKVMKKLQIEIKGVAKNGTKMVNEAEIEKLQYLKAVLKETLRLHPPLPMLLFRENSKAVKLLGYDIAAKTQVIINAWAIQRDPTYWEEPNEFRPDRFMTTSVDFKVLDFNLIPFGAGRRGCPGVSFALANAELALANLVYAFDWKLPDDAHTDSSSVPESPGVTVNRRDPLLAIPIIH